MTDKSKYEGRPSSSFFKFLGLWILWSALIGLVTTVVLGTALARLADNGGLQISSLLMVALEIAIATVGFFALSRWQGQTLFNKTGREIKAWALWSTVSWMIGLLLALIISLPIMLDMQDNVFATIGLLGLDLAIIYGASSFVQSWLLSQHIDYTWMYVIVMLASVFFWALFIGDPRKIAVGGLLAPALQGLFSGMSLMWLFHLSKLGNIAQKSKHESVEESA